MDRDLKEIVTASKTIYQGKILTLRVDRVIANGHETNREIVDKGGAVAIVALKEDGKVVMVRQWRIAVEEALLEIPAGLMEPGEDPLACAKRELEEETGYQAESWSLMAQFYPSAGFCNEYVYIYLARFLTPGKTHPDETENIQVLEYDLDQLFAMIETGEIHDGKTVAGISLAKNRKGK